jgi:histidinol-phosphate aminotransferase
MSMTQTNPHYDELAVPGVRGLQPYEPGKPLAELEREFGIQDAVKLASNENPLGPSPLALAAAREALADVARYPEGSGHLLVEQLAGRHGMPAASITLGNGSNDVLDMIARVFLGPGLEAVFSQHAFAVYPIVTQAVGARARVAVAHDGTRGPVAGHDLGTMHALVGPDTRVVFIANPNNPTGTWLTDNELHEFIASLPRHVMVVVDEAYFEYVVQEHYTDSVPWLEEFPNLIITRTFSKAYGLAGLRVGYAVSHPEVAGLLNRVRQPFNVNTIAQAAAVAALGDEAHLENSVQNNLAGLQQLAAGFEKLGLGYIESVANFIAVDTGQRADGVYRRLLEQGVIVRPIAGYGLPDHLRVSVGLPEENLRLLAALKKALA